MTLNALTLAPLLVGLTLAPAALGQGHRGRGHGDAPQRERFERKARVMRLLAITEALELTDAQALQLDKTLEKYDARRRPLQDTILQGVELLRRAARGDSSADGEVDATLKKMVAARSQLHAIDFEMFQEIAKGLSPQKRARLALVMARLPADLRALARHAHRARGSE
jgi:Spy/CpxP family protein refolding chaperone